MGVTLNDTDKYMEFEEELYRMPGIQVVSMRQVRGVILKLIGRARVLAVSVAIIAIFVAVIGVLNTILMSTFERTQEIGIMKAIGASSVDIFRLFWCESILLCATGGIIGAIIALSTCKVADHLVRNILPYAPRGELVLITPSCLLLCFLGTLVMGVLAGIYPALRASKKRPVEAIHGVVAQS